MKNTITMEKSIRYLVLTIIILAAKLAIVGSNANTSSKSIVEVVELDLEPADSTDFDLMCTGDQMVYNDVELFRPIIRLVEPVPKAFDNSPTGFDVFFYIRVRSDGLDDPIIGYFWARFDSDFTETTDITTINDRETIEDFLGTTIKRMPVGAPPQENNLFWLGCTMQCKVRGNGPQGDAAEHEVYLQSPRFIWLDDAARVSDYVGLLRSPSHRVRCLPQS